jgi:hypothetical protein
MMYIDAVLKIFMLLLFPQLAFSQADSLKFVRSAPYMRNCDDAIFWNIVCRGKDIVPALLDKMTDTARLEGVYVPNFGGEYTVADVAFQAIEEIIAGIPAFELLGIPFDEECGRCTYWLYVRAGIENRRRFQKALREWYELNKDKLIWTESPLSLTGDCISPAKGHYKIKN